MFVGKVSCDKTSSFYKKRKEFMELFLSNFTLYNVKIGEIMLSGKLPKPILPFTQENDINKLQLILGDNTVKIFRYKWFDKVKETGKYDIISFDVENDMIYFDVLIGFYHNEFDIINTFIDGVPESEQEELFYYRMINEYTNYYKHISKMIYKISQIISFLDGREYEVFVNPINRFYTSINPFNLQIKSLIEVLLDEFNHQIKQFFVEEMYINQ